MARSTSSNPRYTASQITTAVTTTVGMTLTLLMMGLLIVMAYLGSQWEKQLRQEARVQVFFQRELDATLLESARETLRTDPSVERVSYLDAATASRELELELGESFVDFLGYIPLADVMDIQMKGAWSTTEELTLAVERMEQIPGVEEVVWQKALLQQIESTLDRLFWPLLGLALVFLLAAIALINNTIRLTVYARRFIIKTMQLVGAHPQSIRNPFIRQGLLYGVLSASLAFASINGLLFAVQWHNTSLAAFFSPLSLLILWGILLVLGATLGGISTAVAVNRFLRKRLDSLH
ncbi:MAG: permease-like cell division protein FtsX [Flavobacteriales bacterium]|jgi:cell division transport system permease protein|nr:permease-like cell division protein FtsX [Flavobacteriales bacterium]